VQSREEEEEEEEAEEANEGDGDEADGAQDTEASEARAARDDAAAIARELDIAQLTLGAKQYSAAAARFLSAWSRARRRYLAVSKSLEKSHDDSWTDPSPLHQRRVDELVALGRDMSRAVLLGLRAVSRGLHEGLEKLANSAAAGPRSPSHAAPLATSPPGRTPDDLGANSPNGPALLAAFPLQPSTPPSDALRRFTEQELANLVLGVLDDALCAEALGSAAMATFAGDDDVGPVQASACDANHATPTTRTDNLRALAAVLWVGDIRKAIDVTLGLLDLRRPAPTGSSAQLRAFQGGHLAEFPFGTGQRMPRALADAAKSYLAHLHGLRGSPTLPASGGAPLPSAPAARGSTVTTSPMKDAAGPMGQFNGEVDSDVYEDVVARLLRQCVDERMAAVVYTPEFPFYSDVAEGRSMNPFLSLQDYLQARFAPTAATPSFAFVLCPTAPCGRRIRSTRLTGVAPAVADNLARLQHVIDGSSNLDAVASGGGARSGAASPTSTPSRGPADLTTTTLVRHKHQLRLGMEAVLGSLHRTLVAPVRRLLPTGAIATAAARGSRLGGSGDGVFEPPHVAFVTMWSAVEAARTHHALTAGPGTAVHAPPSPNPLATSAGGAHATVSPLHRGSGGAADHNWRRQVIVPFHALLMDDGHHLIEDFAVTVTPSLAGLLAARSTPEAASVRSLVPNCANRIQRPPWLSTVAARALHARGRRDRGAEAAVRWTVLADDTPPTAASGVTADLFIATAPYRGAHAAYAASPSVASSALVSLWGPSLRHGTAVVSPDDAGTQAHAEASSDSDDGDSHPLQRMFMDDARAFSIAVVRRVLDSISSAPNTSPSLAHTFRHALLATRAEQPGAAVAQWASLCLLHGGGRLDTLRAHVNATRASTQHRYTAARARVSVRGPLSAAEARNVRYVQEHDVPGVFDAMCRELLVSKPSDDIGVLTALIAVLEEMNAASLAAAALTSSSTTSSPTAPQPARIPPLTDSTSLASSGTTTTVRPGAEEDAAVPPRAKQ
jgi:hypothetical protein